MKPWWRQNIRMSTRELMANLQIKRINKDIISFAILNESHRVKNYWATIIENSKDNFRKDLAEIASFQGLCMNDIFDLSEDHDYVELVNCIHSEISRYDMYDKYFDKIGVAMMSKFENVCAVDYPVKMEEIVRAKKTGRIITCSKQILSSSTFKLYTRTTFFVQKKSKRAIVYPLFSNFYLKRSQ